MKKTDNCDELKQFLVPDPCEEAKLKVKERKIAYERIFGQIKMIRSINDRSKGKENADEVIIERKNGSVVAMTGTDDFVVDPSCPSLMIQLDNGHPLMTKVTGIGCALSASVAAFLALAKSDEHKRRIACLTALAVSSVAGELAADESRGPGTFAVAYLDKLASISEEDLEKRLKILN
ncbi:hypothetical protein niasHS_011627 [Heterodera schachtii]|uniref:hydroxyethylthiazole kinase n=1 Tax=Heterodera schachtii TaxID=97005 RepID=A0ABD2IBY5_HETSC